jgi:SAM-dependent methyltransferase
MTTGIVDLVTVAQALHWFSLDAFYREVTRVLAPGGVLAVWTYGNVQLDDVRIDDVIGAFYHGTVGTFWPPERRHVEEGYRDLAFPFEELAPPSFRMEAHWMLPDLLGYIRSWSAVARFESVHGNDPVLALERELAPLWGPSSALHHITWPLLLRVGRAKRPGQI